MKRRKILFLITKSNLGGAQRYVYDLARSLPKDTYECIVALGGDGVLIEMLEKENIRVIHIPSLKRNISLSKEFLAFWNIGKIIRDEDPDILHVNSSKAGGIGTFLGRLLGVPRVIFTAHGWAFNEDRPGWQKFILKYIHWLTVLFSHATIAVSKATKKQMNWPLAERKMKLVYNGIVAPNLLSREEAREFFIRKIPELQAHKNDLWSTTIAELHPVKQHDTVISAYTTMKPKPPATRHIIIGDGELQETLEKQAAEHNLSDHIFFAGHIHEAAQYLKAFDIFILPSRSETFGYVLLEAAHAKLPIIAGNVGGIPEIITHNHDGILFKSGNSDKLSESLTTLISNGELRTKLGENAYASTQKFTFKNMLEVTQEIYTSK